MTTERYLALQYAVASVLAAASPLDETIPFLLEAICEHLDWPMGSYWAMYPSDDVLHCRTIWNTPSQSLDGFAAECSGLTFAPGSGLPGSVWANRQPATSSDLAHNTAAPRAQLAVAAGVQEVVGFPIQADAALHGVMVFFSHQRRELTAALVQALTVLGRQIGGFIDRVRADEAQRASEEGFRLLFANNPQPMWVYDLQTLAFLEVNYAAIDQYGYSRDEFLAMRLPEIRPLEDVARLLEDVSQQRPPLQRATEWRHRRKDGQIIDVAISSHTLTFAGHGAVLVCVRDITAQKRAEAALRASEERLRTVVTNAPIVLFAVDRDGIFTLSDGKGLTLLGLRPGEHVGKSYFDLYAHLSESRVALEQALSGEAATTINSYSGFVYETRWMPTRDADGTVTGVIGVSADITERAQAEEKRAARYERERVALAALLAMAHALVDVEPGTALLSEERTTATGVVGRRLAELTRDVLGCRRVSLSTLDSQSGLLQPLAVVSASAADEQVWATARPARLDAADPALFSRLLAGEVVLIDMLEPPFRNQPNPYGARVILLTLLRVGATPVGLLALDYGGEEHLYTPDEITLAGAVAQLSALVIERERLLRDREEARANVAALDEANRRMDEFLGIAGHEMRTPLTTISGHVQLAQRRAAHLLAQEVPVTELVRGLTAIQRLLGRTDLGLLRLNRLVGDLLDVSRIGAGHLTVRLAPADLAALVRDVVDEHRELEATRTILLRIVPTGAVPVHVDKERIAQVLTNYLSNALKYSPPELPVTVSLDVAGMVARVAVRDEGPGVPPAEQARIWDQFYRVAGTEYRHGSSVGLGLGLHISRSIVERHGGQVGVESVPGAGATFSFTIPMVR